MLVNGVSPDIVVQGNGVIKGNGGTSVPIARWLTRGNWIVLRIKKVRISGYQVSRMGK